MKLTINADHILKELSKKPDRKQTSLYLSQEVYKQFQLDCEDVPPSQVVEMLMRIFSESKRVKAKSR